MPESRDDYLRLGIATVVGGVATAAVLYRKRWMPKLIGRSRPTLELKSPVPDVRNASGVALLFH